MKLIMLANGKTHQVYAFSSVDEKLEAFLWGRKMEDWKIYLISEPEEIPWNDADVTALCEELKKHMCEEGMVYCGPYDPKPCPWCKATGKMNTRIRYNDEGKSYEEEVPPYDCHFCDGTGKYCGCDACQIWGQGACGEPFNPDEI